MCDPPSKLSYETTPLAQDHRNQEIASAQGPPPPYNPPPSSICSLCSNHDNAPTIPYAPTTTTIFVEPLEFNSKPTIVMCPSCNMYITTSVEHEVGILTWLLCFLCVCCFDSECNYTKNVNHFCPICERQLGRYRRPCSCKIVIYSVLIIIMTPIFLLYYLAYAAAESGLLE